MKDIELCSDGVYRWVYEFKMLRNPTILFLIWKIFAGVMLLMWLMLVILSCGDRGFWFDGFIEITTLFAGLLIFIIALSGFGYLIYSVFVLGGKYCVLFEMDEDGVRHTQMQKQFKKAQSVGLITALAGAASGNIGAAGTGLLAASRNSMHTNFKNVKSVEILRSRSVIKVNETLNHNQVYADGEDFDFVCQYIKERVPASVAKKMKF